MIHEPKDSLVIRMVLECQKERTMTIPTILNLRRIRIVHQQGLDNFRLAFMLQCNTQWEITIHISSRSSRWISVKESLNDGSGDCFAITKQQVNRKVSIGI